jgi:lysophospholipase
MTAEVDPNGPKLAIVPSNPPPPGTRAGFFTTSDKIRLRYARWPRTGAQARGTICLIQGRTEFIEKYFETVSDFQKRGFAVATFDFRGQGGSDRLVANRRLGYVDRFDDYWTDLRDFHRGILLPECPSPYYLVGHSMGGLVALGASLRDRLMFDRVFLSSPMVGFDDLPAGVSTIARFAEVLCFLGMGQLPVGRKSDRAPSEQSFEGNPVTSDKRRYMRSVDTLKAMPDLEVSSPSVRWTAAAMRAVEATTTDDFPSSLKIPVLMLAAARDTVVSTNAIEALGLRMRTGRHAVVATAKHELFMEDDDVRAQVFAAFDAFITNQTAL